LSRGLIKMNVHCHLVAIMFVWVVAFSGALHTACYTVKWQNSHEIKEGFVSQKRG
jgi:hypothetical protein